MMRWLYVYADKIFAGYGSIAASFAMPLILRVAGCRCRCSPNTPDMPSPPDAAVMFFAAMTCCCLLLCSCCAALLARYDAALRRRFMPRHITLLPLLHDAGADAAAMPPCHGARYVVAADDFRCHATRLMPRITPLLRRVATVIDVACCCLWRASAFAAPA